MSADSRELNITLPEDTLEGIEEALMELYSVTDNILYDRYSAQGLKEKLDELMEFRTSLSIALTDAKVEQLQGANGR